MIVTSSDKNVISQLVDTIAEGLSHYALKFKYQQKHSENVKGELYTLIRRHCNQVINRYYITQRNINFIDIQEGEIMYVTFSKTYGSSASQEVIDYLNEQFSSINWKQLADQAQFNIIIKSLENFKS